MLVPDTGPCALSCFCLPHDCMGVRFDYEYHLLSCRYFNAIAGCRTRGCCFALSHDDDFFDVAVDFLFSISVDGWLTFSF